MLTKDEIQAQTNQGNTIEFKNEWIAIIRFEPGQEVEFIQAFEKLTSELYTLRASESIGETTKFFFQCIIPTDLEGSN